jgi:enoyl-CoA hydratase/carnithine racemase
MPTLDRTDEVFVLDLGSDNNVFNPVFVEGFAGALDEVEASPPPRGLVTTASGDFFSTGFDLEWIAANPGRTGEIVAAMHELFARLLELPVPTIAALRRHALAGGGLLALAHDHRVMREDRGYFVLPEVDVRIAFTRGTTDLVRSRLRPQVAHEALTSGRRYTGLEAHAAGIVDELASEHEVVPTAVAIASRLSGKDPTTYGAIKATLYRETIASLRDPAVRSVGPERFEFALDLWRQAQSAPK